MKIFLTGGSGFIGRNILESPLAGKHSILAPSHSELELLDEDAVRGYLERHSVDVVLHGAVRPGHRNAKDPSRQLEFNTRMFFNIVRNSHLFKKMIVLGSGLVYDQRHYRPRMMEGYFDAHVPSDEGGLSKYVINKYIERSENIVDLRIFGIFGRYEDYSIRFISNMICKAILDLPLTMHQNRRFDYISIGDLVPVLGHFIENDFGHSCYNVTPDTSVELKSLAELVLDISGKDMPLMIARPGMGVEYSGDNSRLRGEVTGLSFTPLRKSIEALYGWYFEQRDRIDRESLLVDK
ncbi:MAG: NAD(P)-dependent oxidoreductase [Spirochaetes bacterium]|nr:NAD(P)-dependent oxidoreductase [Spirochaetota bacterium]